MFTIDAEYKGLVFSARCVVSVNGSAHLKNGGVASVTFFNDPHGAIMSKSYTCDLSENQGVDDVEVMILGMSEYEGAKPIT